MLINDEEIPYMKSHGDEIKNEKQNLSFHSKTSFVIFLLFALIDMYSEQKGMLEVIESSRDSS